MVEEKVKVVVSGGGEVVGVRVSSQADRVTATRV